MDNFDEVKKRAMGTRMAFLNGEISYQEAKSQLKEYKEMYNKKAEEIAVKYGQKPQRFKFGDFLR